MRDTPLADHLSERIELITGWRSHVEVPNIGGGRADVIVNIDNQQFVIEVKRIMTTMSDKDLVNAFGGQACSYTLAGPPFAFLAALDLTHRTIRLSTNSSFWVDSWTQPASGDIRALTGMRVLADVDTPSMTSASPARKRAT